ncbi:MAG: helix-turn-helix domain-containing protein [Pseudomonadota bacterium]
MVQADSMKPSADVVALDEERQKRSDLADTELNTAGGMLKAAREAMGLSTEDVAEKTNIRSDLVTAIEAMELEKLPAQAYTMGFVRAFAREVALPEDALMERFRQQAGYIKPADARRIALPKTTKSQPVDGGRELSVLALIAILAFVLWCSWSLLMRTSPDAPADETRFAFTVEDSEPSSIAPETPQIPAAATTTDDVGSAPENDAGAPVQTTDANPLEDLSEAPPSEEISPKEPLAAAADTAPAETAEAEQPTPQPAEEPAPVIALVQTVRVDPVYPPLCESDAAEVETVTVRFSVNGSGLPVNTQIIRSTNPCFNGSALAALVRWRFDSETVRFENSRGLEREFTFDRPF